MKRKRKAMCCAVAGWLVIAGVSQAEEPVGTAFTYQGFLEKPEGTPVDDTCTIELQLCDHPTDPCVPGTVSSHPGIAVTDGVFTIPDVDFGAGAIKGTGRWMIVSVQYTDDDTPVELSPRMELKPAPHALALPGLYTQENVTSPNVIGGFRDNVVSPSVTGATISGGGLGGGLQVVGGNFATISGGANNAATGISSTVGGGTDNEASGTQSTIGGGALNTASDAATTVGGGVSNTASAAVATVGGGDANVASGQQSTVAGGAFNTASDFFATVGGGRENTAEGTASTVAGGRDNTANGAWSGIGGGSGNIAGSICVGGDEEGEPCTDDADCPGGACPIVDFTTVSGGERNTASAQRSTVSGGELNTAAGLRSTIGGGRGNTASGSASSVAGGDNKTASDLFATVGGGRDNTSAGSHSVVGGGGDNTANNTFSSVGGGSANTASGIGATVGGGNANLGSALRSTIAGGGNNAASGDDSTVGGGRGNSASGLQSTVAGGLDNVASGAQAAVAGGQENQAGGNYSFAVGRRAKVRDGAEAENATGDEGTFVWADSTGADFQSTGSNQFLIRAADGVGIGKNDPAEQLDVAGNIKASGTIQSGSSIIIDGTARTITSDGDVELHVADGRVLRIETNPDSPNVIGGFSGNTVAPGAVAVTIGGGGENGSVNNVRGNYGTVGGGAGNVAGDIFGTPVNGEYATVGGGFGNRASGTSSTVGGGISNAADGTQSTVGGGVSNLASVSESTVGGGIQNTASGIRSTVGGGAGNTAGPFSTSTVGGGSNNTASDAASTIAGGSSNTASGANSAVPGGLRNQAGGNFSFAGGHKAKVRDAATVGDADGDEGTFMWADATDADFISDGPNRFLVRASGGTVIYSNNGLSMGVELAANGGSWTSVSDRNLKKNITQVDGREVLERLAGVPIATWNYKAQDPSIRHIGPMGQDFHAAFGVGDEPPRINTIDADGVALAAIQGLHQVVQEKDCEIEELKEKNARLEERLVRVEALLSVVTSEPKEARP